MAAMPDITAQDSVWSCNIANVLQSVANCFDGAPLQRHKLSGMAMETIITFELPLKKLPALNKKWARARERWFGWLVSWGGGSIQEFGGSRTNRKIHVSIFRRHVVTVCRNQYHDRSDAERADEYLRKWSACEKELQMFRLAALGEGVADDVKKVIRDSLGVDLDEGTVR
jgi:hypothetical protein